MSRKLLAFLLSELNTVRILCRKCSAVAEMPLADLGRQPGHACRFCNAPFSLPPKNPGPFAALAQAIGELQKMNSAVDVEFVLPDKE